MNHPGDYALLARRSARQVTFPFPISDLLSRFFLRIFGALRVHSLAGMGLPVARFFYTGKSIQF